MKRSAGSGQRAAGGGSFLKIVDDKVSDVLVMTFVDGVTMWRHGLSARPGPDVRPAFSFRGCDGRTPSWRYASDDRVRVSESTVIDVLRPTVLRRADGREAVGGTTPHFRSALVALGVLRPFQTHVPFLADDSLTAQNPYVGRFAGRDVNEVLPLLRALEIEVRSMPPRHVKIVREPLFCDGTSMWLQAPEPRKALSVQIRRDPEWVGARDVSGAWKEFFALEEALPWLMGTLDRGRAWRVLPQDDAEVWWSDYMTVEGEPSVPVEEIELYQMLGEQIPWFWSSEAFVPWATERWG